MPTWTIAYRQTRGGAWIGYDAADDLDDASRKMHAAMTLPAAVEAAVFPTHSWRYGLPEVAPRLRITDGKARIACLGGLIGALPSDWF